MNDNNNRFNLEIILLNSIFLNFKSRESYIVAQIPFAYHFFLHLHHYFLIYHYLSGKFEK